MLPMLWITPLVMILFHGSPDAFVIAVTRDQCPYFGDRGPTPVRTLKNHNLDSNLTLTMFVKQPNLPNCTWYAGNSCCKQVLLSPSLPLILTVLTWFWLLFCRYHRQRRRTCLIRCHSSRTTRHRELSPDPEK